MGWGLLLLLIAVLVAALVLLGRRTGGLGAGDGKRAAALEYEACGALLSPAEAAFYPVLVEAAKAGPRTDPLRHASRATSPAGAGEEFIVMCRVRLGDLIRPRKGLNNSERAKHANRVDRKHVDFVVVRASDFGVVAAVELDDSSRQREKAKERDGSVDGAGCIVRQKPVYWITDMRG